MSLTNSAFLINRSYSDTYALIVGSEIQIIGIASSVDLFKISNNSVTWYDSKTLGDANAWNTSATSYNSTLLVAGPFEHSWSSPSFYGTDIGVWTYLSGAESYVSFPYLRGYDWEVSTDIVNGTGLILWRNKYDLVLRSFNLSDNSYSNLYTIRLDSQNEGKTLQNPNGALIDSSKGAAV